MQYCPACGTTMLRRDDTRIAELEAENQRLRAALNDLYDWHTGDQYSCGLAQKLQAAEKALSQTAAAPEKS